MVVASNKTLKVRPAPFTVYAEHFHITRSLISTTMFLLHITFGEEQDFKQKAGYLVQSGMSIFEQLLSNVPYLASWGAVQCVLPLTTDTAVARKRFHSGSGHRL